MTPLTPGQRQALDQLREIVDADPAAVEVLAVRDPLPGGHAPIEVSIAAAGAADPEAVATGPRAQLRSRERFLLLVPPDFPFDYPLVEVTHDRFAELPHVQWRRHLCLYISPTTEWTPSDGMFGFLDRLKLWLSRAASGTLDATGAPLHPPPAYTTPAAGALVIRADTPEIGVEPWVGFAVLQPVGEERVDLVGWVPMSEQRRPVSVTEQFGVGGGQPQVGLAVLLSEPTAFEFPTSAAPLLTMLDGRGVARVRLINGLTSVAVLNERLGHAGAVPTYILIGTPMRGTAGGLRKHHLTAWRLEQFGADVVALLPARLSRDAVRADAGHRIAQVLADWLPEAALQWAIVYEQRPEVTQRRDRDTPAASVRGGRALVLGCGALGARVAEHLVRSGAAAVTLVDRARVTPGVLVRQPFDDADIHQPKARVLAERLRRIRPDVSATEVVDDAAGLFATDRPLPDVDLVVDATANPALAARVEHRLRGVRHPTLFTVLIGYAAERGIVTIARSTYTGAGIDVLRKVKLAALQDPQLGAFAGDFFPDPPRTDHFQPEPGCSAATFRGSDSQVAGLVGTLLTHALALLSDERSATAHAVLVDLGLSGSPITRRLTWPADLVRTEPARGTSIRITPAAVAAIRAECRLSSRLRGDGVETGGLLLGEIDDASGVIWVSAATGPPPDSRASATSFVCGIEGVEQLLAQHDRNSRGSVRFIGMWHSHPGGTAAPSSIDEAGMRDLLVPVARAPRRAVLTIVGGPPNEWEQWLRDTQPAAPPAIYVRLCDHPRGTDDHAPAGGSLAAAMARNPGPPLRRWPPARPLRPRPWWRTVLRRPT